MKNISTAEETSEGHEGQVFRNFKSYFLNPVKGGIFGFAAFFGLLSAIKYFSFMIGSQPHFSLDVTDVTLSLLGFVLVFLIKLLENFQEKEP
ncbi:MAG: hypothetical protein HF314_09675 [Ignavibacteria bacterium]|jgi:hypothetical protein|nr:hypothetical protein [Ignavibacteria bacterium]MCU7503333.1 hypothetical protein [Ignavibacteria bacterium]MCU7515721.1 hypothetical protein [Ignavibacteria bacterium]